MKDVIEITIKVDSNDADYLIETSIIPQEILDEIKPLIEAIKNFKSYKKEGMRHHHNYPNGEYHPREDLGELGPDEIYPQFDEEIFETFEEFCPCGEYGFHTIEEVSIQINPKREILLKR